MLSLCACPIDSGCSGTLPRVSSKGRMSQRDQFNGPTRVALTADTLTKSSEQALQLEQVSKAGRGSIRGREERKRGGRRQTTRGWKLCL